MSGSGQPSSLQMQPLANYPFNPMASQQAQAPAYDVVNQFMKNWMQGGYPGYLPSSGIIPGIAPMPSVAPVSVGNAIYQASLNPKPAVAPVAPTAPGYTGRGDVNAINPPPPATRGGYVETLMPSSPAPYIEMPSATQISPSRGSYQVPYVQMPMPANPVPYIEMPSAVQIPSIFSTRRY